MPPTASRFGRPRSRGHGEVSSAARCRRICCGHSAGGHLVALLATDDSYLKALKIPPTSIKAVVPLSGVYTIVPGLFNAQFGSDAEICRAWRHTFEALQRARGLHLRAMIVETRQLLLDEVTDRYPAQVRAWLESGAHAGSGPDRFIPRGGGHPEAA